MSSINAETVALEVTKKVRNGKKVILGEIIRKQGYAQSVSTAPTKVTKTKSYQRVISPLVKQLEDERQAILDRLPAVRNKAKYRDLTDGLDKVTKTIQLLTGRATENIAIAELSDADKAKLDLLLDVQRTSP
jgi:hypothetical protein